MTVHRWVLWLSLGLVWLSWALAMLGWYIERRRAGDLADRLYAEIARQNQYEWAMSQRHE